MEFSTFLFEAHRYLETKYQNNKNPLIKFSLKVLDWCRSWQYNQVSDYMQLLKDYPFWESRQYYRERMQKFVAYKLSIGDFIAEVLYPRLSNIKEARELEENFRRQTNIKLDPRSFGFSKIISNLIPILEGFDQDPEESFFTEEEFREIIKNSLIKVEKYFINES